MASRLADMVSERVTYSGDVYVLGGAVVRDYARFLTFEESAVLGVAVNGGTYDIHIENGAGWARAPMVWSRTAGTLTLAGTWLTVRRSDAAPSTDAPDLTTGIATATVVLSAASQANTAALQDMVEDADARATAAEVSAAEAAASAVIATSSSPIGSIVEWPLASPPTNWLICDGTAVSRTLWPLLFALYGTTFGAGDGVNTFTLPDFRGKFVIQVDGSHAIRTTGGAASVTSGAGGAHTPTITVANHTLTTAEMPAHHHGLGSAASGGAGFPGGLLTNSTAATTLSADTGGDGGHNHTATAGAVADHTHTVATVPPYVALHRIVRAG